MSCGRLRTKRFRGPAAKIASSAMAQHDARQPSVTMIDCSHGSSTMAPTPTPEKAMLTASARRRTNQFGRNCECAV